MFWKKFCFHKAFKKKKLKFTQSGDRHVKSHWQMQPSSEWAVLGRGSLAGRKRRWSSVVWKKSCHENKSCHDSMRPPSALATRPASDSQSSFISSFHIRKMGGSGVTCWRQCQRDGNNEKIQSFWLPQLCFGCSVLKNRHRDKDGNRGHWQHLRIVPEGSRKGFRSRRQCSRCYPSREHPIWTMPGFTFQDVNNCSAL